MNANVFPASGQECRDGGRIEAEVAEDAEMENGEGATATRALEAVRAKEALAALNAGLALVPRGRGKDGGPQGEVLGPDRNVLAALDLGDEPVGQDVPPLLVELHAAVGELP